MSLVHWQSSSLPSRPNIFAPNISSTSSSSSAGSVKGNGESFVDALLRDTNTLTVLGLVVGLLGLIILSIVILVLYRVYALPRWELYADVSATRLRGVRKGKQYPPPVHHRDRRQEKGGGRRGPPAAPVVLPRGRGSRRMPFGRKHTMQPHRRVQDVSILDETPPQKDRLMERGELCDKLEDSAVYAPWAVPDTSSPLLPPPSPPPPGSSEPAAAARAAAANSRPRPPPSTFSGPGTVRTAADVDPGCSYADVRVGSTTTAPTEQASGRRRQSVSMTIWSAPDTPTTAFGQLGNPGRRNSFHLTSHLSDSVVLLSSTPGSALRQCGSDKYGGEKGHLDAVEMRQMHGGGGGGGPCSFPQRVRQDGFRRPHLHDDEEDDEPVAGESDADDAANDRCRRYPGERTPPPLSPPSKAMGDMPLLYDSSGSSSSFFTSPPSTSSSAWLSSYGSYTTTSATSPASAVSAEGEISEDDDLGGNLWDELSSASFPLLPMPSTDPTAVRPDRAPAWETCGGTDKERERGPAGRGGRAKHGGQMQRHATLRARGGGGGGGGRRQGRHSRRQVNRWQATFRQLVGTTRHSTHNMSAIHALLAVPMSLLLENPLVHEELEANPFRHAKALLRRDLLHALLPSLFEKVEERHGYNDDGASGEEPERPPAAARGQEASDDGAGGKEEEDVDEEVNVDGGSARSFPPTAAAAAAAAAGAGDNPSESQVAPSPPGADGGSSVDPRRCVARKEKEREAVPAIVLTPPLAADAEGVVDHHGDHSRHQHIPRSGSGDSRLPMHENAQDEAGAGKAIRQQSDTAPAVLPPSSSSRHRDISAAPNEPRTPAAAVTRTSPFTAVLAQQGEQQPPPPALNTPVPRFPHHHGRTASLTSAASGLGVSKARHSATRGSRTNRKTAEGPSAPPSPPPINPVTSAAQTVWATLEMAKAPPHNSLSAPQPFNMPYHQASFFLPADAILRNGWKRRDGDGGGGNSSDDGERRSRNRRRAHRRASRSPSRSEGGEWQGNVRRTRSAATTVGVRTAAPGERSDERKGKSPTTRQAVASSATTRVRVGGGAAKLLRSGEGKRQYAASAAASLTRRRDIEGHASLPNDEDDVDGEKSTEVSVDVDKEGH